MTRTTSSASTTTCHRLARSRQEPGHDKSIVSSCKHRPASTARAHQRADAPSWRRVARVAAAADAVLGLTMRSDELSNSEPSKSEWVACPSQHRVVGGGAQIDDDGRGVRLAGVEPWEGGWPNYSGSIGVYAEAPGLARFSWSLKAYAVRAALGLQQLHHQGRDHLRLPVRDLRGRRSRLPQQHGPMGRQRARLQARRQRPADAHGPARTAAHAYRRRARDRPRDGTRKR